MAPWADGRGDLSDLGQEVRNADKAEFRFRAAAAAREAVIGWGTASLLQRTAGPKHPKRFEDQMTGTKLKESSLKLPLCSYKVMTPSGDALPVFPWPDLFCGCRGQTPLV